MFDESLVYYVIIESQLSVVRPLISEMAYDGRRRLLSAGSLYVDVDKDLKEAFDEFSKDDNQGELNWSLKTLRSEFKFKGNDILFKYYMSRLQHRFFTVLLMLNIVVTFIDSFWYFFFKVSLNFVQSF